MISPATRLRQRDQRFYAVYPYPESDRVPHRDAELLRNSLCQKSWFLALDYEMTIDSFSGLIIPVMKRLSKWGIHTNAVISMNLKFVIKFS